MFFLAVIWLFILFFIFFWAVLGFVFEALVSLIAFTTLVGDGGGDKKKRLRCLWHCESWTIMGVEKEERKKRN